MTVARQRHCRYHRDLWCIAAAVAALTAGFRPGSGVSAQAAREARELVPGVALERGLAGGEQHDFRVSLGPGQFLDLVVEQKGIDVVVALVGPSGDTLVDVDSPNGVRGPEPLRFVADTGGDYRIVVRSLEAQAGAGAYKIAVRERRDATPADRAHVAAAKAQTAAMALKARGTAAALREAIAQFKIALPLWKTAGDRRHEATTLVELADALLDLNANAEALSYLEPALATWRAETDQPRIADTLNTIGSAYEQLHRSDEALRYYREALATARAAGARDTEGSALNNIATTYSAIGERDRTLAFLQQALAVFQATGNRREEATALNNIGQVLNRTGENQRALEYLRRSLQIAREVGGRFTELNLLNNIGSTFKSLGEFSRALIYHREALSIAQGLGNRLQEAKLLNNIGADYKSLGDDQMALEHYNRSLTLAKTAGDTEGEARALGNIGAILYENLSQLDPARDRLNQALTLWRVVGDLSGVAQTLAHLAQIAIRRGDLDTATEYSQESLTLARRDRDRNREAATLIQLAVLARTRGNLADARARSDEALAVVESLRRDVADFDLRASYLATVQRAYAIQIDILMRLHATAPDAGHDIAALDVAERARARSLLDALADAGGPVQLTPDPALLERQRDLQQRLDAAALNGGSAARTDIEKLLAEYEDVRTKLRLGAAPSTLPPAQEPLQTPAIQRILDADTVLLEYALGEERSYVWIVTPGIVRSAALPARKEIDAAAARLYTLLTARSRRPAGEAPAQRLVRLGESAREVLRAASTLSRMLLTPAAPLLAGKRIVVVTGGSLQMIPFAVLQSPAESVPLIVGHEVVHVPSASAVNLLRREHANRAVPPRTVAVLADAVFDAGDTRVPRGVGRPSTATLRSSDSSDDHPAPDWQRAASASGLSAVGTPLPRLRYSRDEAHAILAMVRPSERLQALDFRASRETLLSNDLTRYRILHVATHGFINPERPELSGLVLSMVDEQGRPVDGFLRLHLIYSLRLPADLVVLSACQTALGKDITGEGIVGLTRGFMQAGATRVVSSLWKVDDQATAELMTIFYRGMLGRQRLRPAAALRAAQIAMWKETRWRDPYYWAAFTLQGEWR